VPTRLPTTAAATEIIEIAERGVAAAVVTAEATVVEVEVGVGVETRERSPRGTAVVTGIAIMRKTQTRNEKKERMKKNPLTMVMRPVTTKPKTATDPEIRVRIAAIEEGMVAETGTETETGVGVTVATAEIVDVELMAVIAAERVTGTGIEEETTAETDDGAPADQGKVEVFSPSRAF
jgi:hypothetical protein